MGEESLTKAVLLVEDSEEDVFFFKRALAKSGVGVELLLAADGKTAVSLLSDREVRQRLGLVFLDLKLPLLNGFDVLRWIRSEHFDPPLRVVVLSGSAHKSDKALANELGAPDYLVKPITAESIRDRLNGP
jgi:DNA-binding response OmpR family regulator